jgi:MGT family glycosyltransferase
MASNTVSNSAASPRAFLFTHWEGGGNTPPMLAIVTRLIAKGHHVRVMSDPCNREEVEATGATFVSWTRAPQRADKTIDSDPLRDWEVTSPPAMIGRLRDRIFIGPAQGHAEDVREELSRRPADAVVTSEMLFGAMAGAEAARVPCVALSANIYMFPQDDVPPMGPGFMPATNVLHRLRDRVVKMIMVREFGKGTTAFNKTRQALGLSPLGHPFEQLNRLARHLVLTSAAFDFTSRRPPRQVMYAGPELGDPAWTTPWTSPWQATDRRPLVLVGFSTTFQNQLEALRRVVAALGTLDVRAVVTTGPSIDVATLPAAANVHVCVSAPHSELLKEAALAISHCGHGTVIRALAAGVPLVCMPMGRDQNDNAARVVFHGAGVRLSPAASAEAIEKAVRQVLGERRYREAAQQLSGSILSDTRKDLAVSELERLARVARALGSHERAS